MKGTVTLDAYVLDTLMADLVAHDRRPSAFLVYLAIWTAAKGREVAMSYADIAESTGLSRSTAQSSVSWLLTRELLSVTSDGRTGTPRYRVLTPWRRWQSG